MVLRLGDGLWHCYTHHQSKWCQGCDIVGETHLTTRCIQWLKLHGTCGSCAIVRTDALLGGLLTWSLSQDLKTSNSRWNKKWAWDLQCCKALYLLKFQKIYEIVPVFIFTSPLYDGFGTIPSKPLSRSKIRAPETAQRSFWCTKGGQKLFGRNTSKNAMVWVRFRIYLVFFLGILCVWHC